MPESQTVVDLSSLPVISTAFVVVIFVGDESSARTGCYLRFGRRSSPCCPRFARERFLLAMEGSGNIAAVDEDQTSSRTVESLILSNWSETSTKKECREYDDLGSGILDQRANKCVEPEDDSIL